MKRTNEKLAWLFKLSIHTFVCWSLTLFQILPGGITQVRADDVLDGASETTSAADTTPTSGGLTAAPESGEGSSGVVEVNGNEIKATGKFLFANMGLVAIGLGAPSLIKECSNKWSVRVFAASAGIYVLNEIGLFTRFNHAINKEMKAYLGRGDEDRQIESLETAAKQTRKAKEAAKRRALIAKVAAGGFLAASALAIVEKMGKFGMDEPCVPMGAFKAPPKTQSFYVYQIDEKLQPIAMIESNEVLSKNLADYLNQPRIRDHFYYGNKSNQGIMAKFTNSILPKAHAQEQVGTENDARVVEGKDGKQTIIVNSVGAKLAAIGLGAAGGLALMQTTSSVFEPIKKNIIKNPIGRAVGFGVFGATAMGAAKESEEAADKLDGRADEYDRLAESLRGRVDQNIDTQTGGTSQFIDQTVQNVDDGSGSSIDNNSICATGGASTGLKPDVNCDCAKTNKCASPQIPNTTGLPSFAGSGLLSESIGSLNGSAANLFSGRLKEATTKGQAMSNNAARITKLRDALKKKFNEDRLKDKQKPVDFEKAEAGFARGLNNQIEKAFNNLSGREQAALARLGTGFGTGSGSDSEDDKKDSKVADDDKKGTSKVAAVDVNPNAGKASNKSNDGAVWDFNFDEEAADAKAEQAAIAAALAEQEDENYVVDGDINDDRNKNLFNIITRRYLKSAYPVIFEEQ